MAVYEALLLNTAVPQIQAAQAGDSYVMVVNATTPALRITQTGTGNAISVEDEANPDATPFVVSAAGDVGIGTNAPAYKLEVNGGASDAMSLFNSTNANGAHLRFAASGTVKSYIGGAPGFLGSGTADDLGIRAVGSVLFATNGSSVDMTLDSSGNLGLGVTPSASTLVQFEGGSNLLLVGRGNAYLSNNATFNSGFKYISTAAAGQYNISGGAHSWSTAASDTAGNAISFIQAMTLDASGNLLVGTTSSSTGNVNGTIAFGGADAGIVYLQRQTGTDQLRFYTGGNRLGYVNTASSILTLGTANFPLVFATNDTERARITSGGDFRVKGAGTAGSTDAFQVSGSAPADAARINSSGSLFVGKTATGIGTAGVEIVGGFGQFTVNNDASLFTNRLGSDGDIVKFYRDTSQVGSISVTTTATAYNTSSDYRLKDNPQPLTNSGAFIDALKPKAWDWKADGSKGVGFIAHEAQEVSPSSVVGAKDAVDADGKPVMQAMEYGSAEFIANIVAELQSLRARVAQLEAK